MTEYRYMLNTPEHKLTKPKSKPNVIQKRIGKIQEKIKNYKKTDDNITVVEIAKKLNIGLTTLHKYWPVGVEKIYSYTKKQKLIQEFFKTLSPNLTLDTIIQKMPLEIKTLLNVKNFHNAVRYWAIKNHYVYIDPKQNREILHTFFSQLSLNLTIEQIKNRLSDIGINISHRYCGILSKKYKYKIKKDNLSVSKALFENFNKEKFLSKWNHVDWNLPNKIIAIENNCSVCRVTQVRFILGKTNKNKKTQWNWNSVDWNKTNEEIAKELGCSKYLVGLHKMQQHF